MLPCPQPPTTFIGRDPELHAIGALLAGGAHLVTLVGLGGVGKTRLALAAAARADKPVAYVDALGVRDAAELAMAIAAAAELDHLARPSGRVLPMARVAAALGKLGPLVVLVDNVEQVASQVADALIELVSRAPAVQVLLTSRVALGRPEERVVTVAPLTADGPDSAAVELLLARVPESATSVWAADRAALARLASRLDGLPLALELAAARAHLIGPDELLALLDERSSLRTATGHVRRSSREAAVAWSWGELGAERQAALGRLAVLGGSFDLELAAAVIGGSRAAALEVIEVLAGYSLLAPEAGGDSGMRYRVLETVRDFVLGADAIPDDARATATEAAHTAIAEALLARVEPHLSAFSRELPPAIAQRVARDRDLYLAVLRRGLDTPGLAPLTHALRVSVALVPLFSRAGFGETASAWTCALLDRAEVDAVPLPTRLGAALVTVVAAASGDDHAIIDRLVARVGRWLEGGGSGALITSAFGIVHYHRWDHPTLLALADSVLRSDLAASPEVYAYALAAQVSSRRALGRAPQDDDQRLADALTRLPADARTTTCLVLLTRAFLAIHRGDAERGIALTRDGLARSAGTQRMFDALFHLERARGLHDLGRLGAAELAYGEALAAFDRRPSRERQETLLDHALLALERGRHERVAELLAETSPHLATTFEHGFHRALTIALARLGGTSLADAARPTLTGTVEDAAFDALAALGGTLVVSGPFGDARAASFRVRRAERLWRAADAITHGRDEAMALALDGSALRVGDSWTDLSTRPLIRALANALAVAQADAQVLDRDTLGAALWPDERLSPETRDQRLHTAVSTLRRCGVEVAAHEGGYRFDPARPVVWVEPAAWPGPGGELQRARGRGRPKRG